MPNDLFGIDIAGIIAENITDDDVLPATLGRRVERGNEDDLTDAPRKIPYNYSCRGFTETLTIKDTQRGNITAMIDDRRISIIGDSLPAGIVPTQGDTLTIEDNGVNIIFKVLGLLERDPAAALYVIHARQ